MSIGITEDDFDRIREYLDKEPHRRRPDDLMPPGDEELGPDER